jgi:hypothetical protein
MAERSASKSSFIAAAASLPAWVIIVGKCTVAYADDYNPAGVAIWAGFSFVIAIPFGWIVGYLVSPAIYTLTSTIQFLPSRPTIALALAATNIGER